MKSDDTTQELLPFLAEATDTAVDEVHLESHLLEDLDMDSLSVLELTVFTEEKFGVSVEEEFKEAMSDPDRRRAMSVQWLVSTISDRHRNHDS
jgi:acyl carrier protein